MSVQSGVSAVILEWTILELCPTTFHSPFLYNTVANIQNTKRITTTWWLYTSNVGGILFSPTSTKGTGIPTKNLGQVLII